MALPSVGNVAVMDLWWAMSASTTCTIRVSVSTVSCITACHVTGAGAPCCLVV